MKRLALLPTLAAVAVLAGGCDVTGQVDVTLGAAPEDDTATISLVLDGAAADAVDDTVDAQLRELLARAGGPVRVDADDGRRTWTAGGDPDALATIGGVTGVDQIAIRDADSGQTTVTIGTRAPTLLIEAYSQATDDANLATTALAATHLQVTVDVGGQLHDWHVDGPVGDVAAVTEDGTAVTFRVDADQLDAGTLTVAGERPDDAPWVPLVAAAVVVGSAATAIRASRSEQRPRRQ